MKRIIMNIFNDKGNYLEIEDDFTFNVSNARHRIRNVIAVPKTEDYLSFYKLFYKLDKDINKVNTSGGSRSMKVLKVRNEDEKNYNLTVEAYTDFDKVQLTLILEDIRPGKCNSICVFDLDRVQVAKMLEILGKIVEN